MYQQKHDENRSIYGQQNILMCRVAESIFKAVCGLVYLRNTERRTYDITLNISNGNKTSNAG